MISYRVGEIISTVFMIVILILGFCKFFIKKETFLTSRKLFWSVWGAFAVSSTIIPFFLVGNETLCIRAYFSVSSFFLCVFFGSIVHLLDKVRQLSLSDAPVSNKYLLIITLVPTISIIVSIVLFVIGSKEDDKLGEVSYRQGEGCCVIVEIPEE